MSDTFVNCFGDVIEIDPAKHAKPKVAKERVSSHNGWRVVGIPAGAMEAARKEHLGRIEDCTRRAASDKSIRIPKPWDEEVWRRGFKKPAVRSKPYELPEAAQLCKQLAEKAGWTFVDVLELKREGKSA